MRSLAILALLVSTACGASEDAPELSAVTTSKLEVLSGEEFFATVLARDHNGDMHRGVIDIHIETHESNAIDLEASVNVTEIPVGATEANLIVGLTLTGPMPFGLYNVELRLTDNAGNTSDAASARIALVQFGTPFSN
jgi:hypothetical protein